jgi:hypothetical protein
VRSIGGPAAKQQSGAANRNKETCSPQSTEESASWRILKWFPNLGFHLPVGGPPDLDRPIIRLSRQKFTHRIPTNTLDKALVLVEFMKAL